jgi:aspartate carbamoyltransferase catalytic subunit
LRHLIDKRGYLQIALVGDLKNGRTVHSLAKLLCVYTGIKLKYVSPIADLTMPDDIVRYVAEHGGFTQVCVMDNMMNATIAYLFIRNILLICRRVLPMPTLSM